MRSGAYMEMSYVKGQTAGESTSEVPSQIAGAQCGHACRHSGSDTEPNGILGIGLQVRFPLECTEFLPPEQTASSEGACRIVTGTISPNGWCMAFNQK